jgi:hypothetical protein
MDEKSYIHTYNPHLPKWTQKKLIFDVVYGMILCTQERKYGWFLHTREEEGCEVVMLGESWVDDQSEGWLRISEWVGRLWTRQRPLVGNLFITIWRSQGSQPYHLSKWSHGTVAPRVWCAQWYGPYWDPEISKKVLAMSVPLYHWASTLGWPWLVGLGLPLWFGKKNQRRGTTTNNYHSFPFLSIFNPLNNTWKWFWVCHFFHLAIYTFSQFQLLFYSKLFLNLHTIWSNFFLVVGKWWEVY